LYVKACIVLSALSDQEYTYVRPNPLQVWTGSKNFWATEAWSW